MSRIRATVLATDRFIDDAQVIYSERLLNELECTLSRLEVLPQIGSRILAESIVEEFGEEVFKLLLGPFAIIYRYDEKSSIVWLLALIHQRRIW
jgi:plasmid stabilization system protein ParE